MPNAQIDWGILSYYGTTGVDGPKSWRDQKALPLAERWVTDAENNGYTNPGRDDHRPEDGYLPMTDEQIEERAVRAEQRLNIYIRELAAEIAKRDRIDLPAAFRYLERNGIVLFAVEAGTR